MADNLKENSDGKAPNLKEIKKEFKLYDDAAEIIVNLWAENMKTVITTVISEDKKEKQGP